MFYCDECKVKNNWPESLFKSIGKCECCEKVKECNDIPSNRLPMLTTAQFIDDHMKTFLCEHYTEPYEHQLLMLIEAEIKYPCTIKQLFEGLQEFVKGCDTKTSLRGLLINIGHLMCVGVNAKIAGEKLRDVLLELEKKET